MSVSALCGARPSNSGELAAEVSSAWLEVGEEFFKGIDEKGTATYGKADTAGTAGGGTCAVGMATGKGTGPEKDAK